MDDAEKLKEILFEFVKRAASNEGTPEEVAALPGVARVLLEMLG